MPVQILQVTWHCLMYCNNCVNPFIYNYTSKDFRDGFRDVVASWRGSSSAGTLQTSAQAANPAPYHAVGAGAQRVAADDDNDDDGDVGNVDEMTAIELRVGGVYCGPSVEHIQLEADPNDTCP